MSLPLRVTAAVCLLAIGGQPASVWAREAGTPPTIDRTVRIELSPSATVSQEVARFLREDSAWIRSLPALRLLGPPGRAEELSRWIRQAVAAGRRQAAFDAREPGEQSVAARSLLSLLRDRWLARGYLQARMQVADSAGSAVGAPSGAQSKAERTSGPPATVILVDPGLPYRLGKVTVAGRDFPERSRLLQGSLPEPGSRFRLIAWNAGIASLLASAGELGYPFARWVVQGVELDHSRAELHVEAIFLPGVRAIIGSQTSDLPAGRGQGFLKRATGLRIGQRFRESDLVRARQKLLARGIYRWVGEPIVYRTNAQDTIGIHWPVAPVKRANRLTVVLGLSRRGEAEGGRLSGQVDLRLPNLAGTGRRLEAAWSDDGSNRSHFGVSFLEPLAFGTPLDAQFGVDHEVLQDQYTRFRLDNRWQVPVVAAWGIEFGLGWDRSTFPVGSLERTRRVRVRGAFLHRRTDLARSGWEGVFAIETARRQATLRSDTTGTTAGSGFSGDERQRIVEVDMAGEVWLGAVWSLAGRTALRQVTGEGQPIPLSERYRFGGANSVRGYREDEFQGERIAYASVELRVGRAGRSRLYTFWDMGYFEFSALAPTPENPERRQQRSGTVRGFGWGLQTSTPGGDISLAIGFPGSVNFDDAKLHVSLLGAF